MEVGNVRVAEDCDFDLLRVYLSRDEGWSVAFKKNAMTVWTRPSNVKECDLKMIRVKTVFKDVSANVLFDTLLDLGYRKHWDKYLDESHEIGYLNPNNSVGYFSISCPKPLQKRDFVTHNAWLVTADEYLLINHSVYHKDFPPRANRVRALSYISGFIITPIDEHSCKLGYMAHTDLRGKLPPWFFNKLASTVPARYIRKLHRAATKYQAWKSKRQGVEANRPWVNPEQITARRITPAECVQSEEEARAEPVCLDEEITDEAAADFEDDTSDTDRDI